MANYKDIKYQFPASATNSGTFADARIAASNVSQHATTYDDNKLQTNVALLGFKTAVNGSLAKYNLVDQIVDEYTDATGVDASASTNETLLSGVYYGGTTVTPTITQDADATGVDGDYTWYKWTDHTGTGSYSTNTTQAHEYLVVAGGGGGGGGQAGSEGGGGGGAGGYLAATGLSLVGSTSYTITIGEGAGGAPAFNDRGYSGGSSSIAGSDITDIVTTGGGGGGTYATKAGIAGGSGGGGADNGTGGAGNTPSTSPSQGNAGGNSISSSAAGGGGHTTAGGIPTGGDTIGGVGGTATANDITGTNTYYAGGGGGGGMTTGGAGGTNAGNGSNGDGQGTNGTHNTGGGGGGAQAVSSNQSNANGYGGHGIVVLRRLTSLTTAGANLTLQSNDTTASTANPDYADMVCLIENASGTATLNTDIKGYISEDSGVTFTQGTLVDEGTWGTNKKIVAFHDLDISAQTGSAMCYKITTHNQSAGSKETKIHATSIGWR